MTETATATGGAARSGGRSWSTPALTLGQLALMATSLVFSLSLGYAGGLAAVGAVAPAMLVFQLSCGVLQRTLAEATLLSTAHEGRRAERATCRWSVAAALGGGLLGAVVALLSSLAVPDVPVELALGYAAGIPFVLALDVGRSAAVAAGAARSAFLESALWLVVQTASMLCFAALGSPVGICLSWAVVNAAFFLVAAGQSDRRPALRGLLRWLRSRRASMGAASLDAFVVGVTPVLAMQVTAFVSTAATLGVIRVLQQVLAPLAFVSITFRRVLIYRRRADSASTVWQDLRDGLLSLALMAAGAVLLGLAVVLGRRIVPALAFVPVGTALVAAGVEKAALGFSYGCSLSRFVRGEFDVLLRARYVMLGLTVLAAPLMTLWWGAAGYLVGSSLGMVGYSFAVLGLRDGRRPVPAGPRPGFS
ncbi:hypothetical protein [Plantactinospora sp. KLBMP9567]|uniref:hypothetical protein n=1 Tax=Plantactinospora sp. KLBMP9567 TaxID=3085900 RepID=UPI0029812AF4|nr:hypothetical protein [Plantactinospora sp. KLBMP9567]MDW5322480.1 hypothetical protein [Plantactinospora sp. KLBMP9567]